MIARGSLSEDGPSVSAAAGVGLGCCISPSLRRAQHRLRLPHRPPVAIFVATRLGETTLERDPPREFDYGCRFVRLPVLGSGRCCFLLFLLARRSRRVLLCLRHARCCLRGPGMPPRMLLLEFHALCTVSASPAAVPEDERRDDLEKLFPNVKTRDALACQCMYPDQPSCALHIWEQRSALATQTRIT